MFKYWWALRLGWILWRERGYDTLEEAIEAAYEDCWMEYRDAGLSPREAVNEDLSYCDPDQLGAYDKED